MQALYMVHWTLTTVSALLLPRGLGILEDALASLCSYPAMESFNQAITLVLRRSDGDLAEVLFWRRGDLRACFLGHVVDFLRLA